MLHYSGALADVQEAVCKFLHVQARCGFLLRLQDTPLLHTGGDRRTLLQGFFGSGLTVVGICLLVTACLLSFAHFTGVREISKYGASKGRDIGWLDAFIIGCSQAVAVLPGLSRSGTTIATGIILGDKRDKVASFSFLMVIIPILGEALLDIKDIIGDPAAQGENSVGALSLIIGFVASFVVGCCACKWMLELVKKGKLVWFAVYCVIMGIICLLWQ